MEFLKYKKDYSGFTDLIMSFDLKIAWKQEDKEKEEDEQKILLQIADKQMNEQDKHRNLIILQSMNSDEKWLLNLFTQVIDTDTKEIPFLDVDLSTDPKSMKNRLQFWRTLNKYSASLLAYELSLPVPVCYIVTSRKISSFSLEKTRMIAFSNDEIVLDDELGAPETVEEFYFITGREKYLVETSDAFEKLLRQHSITDDETTVLGVLTKMVSQVKTLYEYIESERFDSVAEQLSSLDDLYSLIPFDVWLNDPDRHQGDYLVQFDSNVPIGLIGINYEMWSFGTDIQQEKENITYLRSYLTSIVNKYTNFFDNRILETFFKISTLSDIDIEYLTFAPLILCKFIEYHIQVKNLGPDERFKLLQIEENNRDYLYESVPKIDKLSLRLIKQIGLPPEHKELEDKINLIKEDEFYSNLDVYLENEFENDFEDEDFDEDFSEIEDESI